jgi:hypothetical protein
MAVLNADPEKARSQTRTMHQEEAGERQHGTFSASCAPILSKESELA